MRCAGYQLVRHTSDAQGVQLGMEPIRELSGGFEGLPDDLDLQLDDDVLMALLGDSMDDMADLPLMQPEQSLLQGQEPQQPVHLVQQHQQTLSPPAPLAAAPPTVTAAPLTPLPLPIAHMMPPVQTIPKFEHPSFFPGLPGFPPFPPHLLYPFSQAQLQATGGLMPLAPPQQPCAPAMPKHTPTQQQKHKVGIAPMPVPSGDSFKRKLDVGFVGAGGAAGDVVGGQAKRGPVDDPADTKEVKKQKRLIRNRLSAQLHRERQRQHVDQLEQTIKEKDVEIGRLQTRVDELEKENCSLCAQLNHLRTHARAPSGAGSTQSDSGYTTSGTVSGGTSPVRSDSDSEAQAYLSDSSASGTRPGSMLFSFLLLFTFLAAPSTFLVTKNWTTDTRTTNPVSGLLSSHTWRVPAKATTTRHVETPQLPGPDTIRRIVKPNMDRSLSTAVTSRALMSVQDMSSASTTSHRESAGPVVSPSTEARTTATGSPASSSRIPQQADFVLHPFERRPETWRHKIQELNCAPWQYTESLDLLGGNSTVSREWPSEREEFVIARPDNGGRLRGRTQNSKPVEYAVDVYRASDHSSKQVDIYRDHNPTSALGMSRSPATSYMFCPQAYGLMAHDLVREYWDVNRSGVDDDGKPRVSPYLGRNGAIVLPAGVATEEHRDHGDNARSTDSSSQSTNSSSSTADDHSSAPYLLLLVPSGAVHWGGAAGGASMNGESSGQDAWLEVGCRLTSARIVSDVRFSV